MRERPWQMEPRQARAIASRAERLGMTPEQLVDLVLDHMTASHKTDALRRKLLTQLDWLLEGRDQDDAPYMNEFYATGETPFPVPASQVDTSVERFIFHYLPAALSANGK